MHVLPRYQSKRTEARSPKFGDTYDDPKAPPGAMISVQRVGGGGLGARKRGLAWVGYTLSA